MDVKFDLAELPQVASRFLNQFDQPQVIALHGSMGAGKTTFVRVVCAELGVVDAVNSPTFSLIQEYRTKAGETVYHLDLYRLTDAEEAWHAGVEEVLHSGCWCFVEWPERAAELLPPSTQHVMLQVLDEAHRRMQFDKG